MKILFLAQRVPYPPNKGEKIRTFHQIEFLKRRGHDITVLCPYENPAEMAAGTKLQADYDIDVIAQQLPARYLRLGSGLITGKSLSVAQFYDQKLRQILITRLKEHKFDWVVCTSSAMAFYLKSLPPATHDSSKLAVDFMDLDSDKWSQYANNSTMLLRLIYRREAKKIRQLELYCQKYFDACFFISQNECDLFAKVAPNVENVSAVGNGIDLDTFQPPLNKQINTQSPIFLFTGVMDYLPNEDAVLKFIDLAWPEIQRELPEAKFIVAGMNPTPKIKEKAKAFSGIQLTGFVDDITAFYQKADIFVAPFTMARGVQNKVLQAMACSLPVFTTPMGAEGIRCEANKDIFIVERPELFASTIIEKLKSKEALQAIALAARIRMEQTYDWDMQLDKFEKVLLGQNL